MTLDKQAVFEQCHELTEFCLANKGRCFDGWSKEKLFFYCGFHLLSETLFVSRFNGKVKGIAIAFPVNPEDASEPFNWKLPESGDALMIYDVVGNRQTCADIYRSIISKWPNLNRFFTYRRGNLVELTLPQLERLFA